MTGDSSVGPYRNYYGKECRSRDDDLYTKLCRLEVRNHIYELHTRKRAADKPRWSFYETMGDSLAAWFRRWKGAAIEKFGIVTGEPQRKIELYGAIGSLFIKTYWYQNSHLPRPHESFSLSQVHKAPHPHDVFGAEEPLTMSLDEIREVPISWVARTRPSAFSGGKLRENITNKVAVQFKMDFWENAPKVRIHANNQKVRFSTRHLRMNNGFLNTVAMVYSQWSERDCVRAFWLFKETYGRWPVALVYYQLLTGVCFIAWPSEPPKVLPTTKRIEQKHKKKKSQLSFTSTSELHPHPFFPTGIEGTHSLSVPWEDLP